MPHRDNRRAFASVTNVAIGCSAVVLVIVIGMVSGSFEGVGEAPIPAAASFEWEALLNDVPAAGSPNELHAQTKLAPEDLYERVAPSVVTIIVKDEDDEPIGSGSGFFIEDTLLSDRYDSLEFNKQYAKSRSGAGTPTQFGYVLTNYHVIRPAVSVNAVPFIGDEGQVWQVLAEDENADLALLLVFFSSDEPLKGIPFAPHNPRVLTTVYAIGSPKGLSGSASEGKVSGLRELSTGEQWLQTTAPISPGSSGGPLLLSDGTLAGVTTMFLEDAQNLNFAIPVSVVREFLATAEYRPRDVAEGASFRWHWQSAFSEMNATIEVSESLDGFSRRYTADEKHAIALVEEARGIVLGQENNSRDVMARYRQTIELAKQANNSLPDEFKYLMHCLVGMASWDAGIESIQARRKTFTGQEQAALYGASSYASTAERHLTLATKLRPDSPLGYERLYHSYALGSNWGDALLAADTLVRLMPRCADALQYRGNCYFELKQPESGIKDLRAAIELSPRNGWIRYRFAEHLYELGEYDAAIEAYEAAVELLGNSEARYSDVLAQEAQFYVGYAHKKAGRFAQAISAFSKAKKMGHPAEYCDREIAECRKL